MNSLNFLSSRVLNEGSPAASKKDRTRSYSDGNLSRADTPTQIKRSSSQVIKRSRARKDADEKDDIVKREHLDVQGFSGDEANEKSPLIPQSQARPWDPIQRTALRLVNALRATLQFVLSTLASPCVYLTGSFRDEKGSLSVFTPFRKLRHTLRKRSSQNSTTQAVGLSGSSDLYGSIAGANRTTSQGPNNHSKNMPQISSTSESDNDSSGWLSAVTNWKARTPPVASSSSSDESNQRPRPTRVKSANHDSLKKRKPKKSKVNFKTSDPEGQPALTVATLKSPTSPSLTHSLSKSSHPATIPRPLIPLRQPSYSSSSSRFSKSAQKTLVIDLDETLIHSLAKGGRMSSGHMVEVKLNTAVGFGGGTLGPQHPILYYVHKRPHCDEFLRRVCQWYQLVVFTASVQEYADPVIDWLEQERKYFASRYYRQHCTFRNGAYIKDLSSIEPDLSKVIILDNSPLSYIFHEDNAIPIEGWINDPTDNDLLHLLPILEALQYSTDVRALLSLRRGEMVA